MSFGKKLRYYRKAAGLTQEKLAEIIGKKRVSVFYYEKEKVPPSVDVVIALCDALKITPNDLLLENEQTNMPVKTGMSLHQTELNGDMIKYMDFNKYQQLAERTINQNLTTEEKIDHAKMGMVSEIGEIMSLYQKVYQGHEFDAAHLFSEIGDLLWFMAELCTAMDYNLETIAADNIAKLIKRYPEGFSPENSLHRKEGDI